jgi:hypothetical protein
VINGPGRGRLKVVSRYARGLLALIRRESVESVRELIDIPPRIERVLRYYMRQYPEDAAGIEK